jgi:hypothetical protein
MLISVAMLNVVVKSVVSPLFVLNYLTIRHAFNFVPIILIADTLIVFNHDFSHETFWGTNLLTLNRTYINFANINKTI